MNTQTKSTLIPLGTQTPYGKVASVGWVGERYYWCVDKSGVVAMIPAALLEKPTPKPDATHPTLSASTRA